MSVGNVNATFRQIGRSIGRRLYWIVAHRLPHKLVAVPTPGGRLYLNLTDSPAMVKRVTWLYERPKRRAIQRFLLPGMTFIDIGANIGDFSLVAARKVGATGRVVAVEPFPRNAAQIRRSADLNGYSQVQVHEVALGEVDGRATLHLGDRAAWHTLMPGLPSREVGVLDVAVQTLDSLAGAIGGPIDAIKVDVEGAELQVLRGAEETLRSNRDVVLFLDLHPVLGVDPREVESLLRDWGFSLFNMSWAPLSTVPAGAGEVLARRV